jgi:hypothetical protein
MRFPSDEHRQLSGVYQRGRVIWACSQVEAALAISRSPNAVGWREQSYMQARVISALISLSDCTVVEAAAVFDLTHEQGLARRRKFLDTMTEQEQRDYLDAVRAVLQKAVQHDE